MRKGFEERSGRKRRKVSMVEEGKRGKYRWRRVGGMNRLDSSVDWFPSPEFNGFQ